MKRISSKEAKELNQNFVKTRGKALNKIVETETGNPNKKDAISSWFSLDELKEYIAYVEAEGKVKNITINGLRIYFGAYATNERETNKKGISTVFFVPTQPKKGAQQKDGVTGNDESSDVTEIDGMNRGGLGTPPAAEYPQ